jgi:hypothetical protein
VKNGDGTDNYRVEANQAFAKDLTGKLMLAYGTMDANVSPSQTLLVVDALIKANKDFDLIMLPSQAHGYGDASDRETDPAGRPRRTSGAAVFLHHLDLEVSHAEVEQVRWR